MKIRKLIEPDINSVVALWHITKKRTYSYLPLEQTRTLEEDLRFFRENLIPRCDIRVADENGRIAGFLATRGSYIDRLYVLPELQRRGVGAGLIQHAKELSPAGLELHTHQKNSAAWSFYLKQGFLGVQYGISPPPESEPDVEFHWRPGWQQAPEQEIHLVPYDESWPLLFDQEQASLYRDIGKFVVGSIEHIGSTAVPGLLAKPVIDIMAGVKGLEESRSAIALLAGNGYFYFPYRPDLMHWFCKPSPSFRTHHLHLVPYGSRLWMERIAFRDYLRSHPEAAAEYGDLKQRLAFLHRLDREAYTEAKGPFVRQIIQRALDKIF
jgi:GrpB-like predicted nucleotidyltransferase (UPF0157 family)/GNAT superfamily N-acetyltransferase